MLTGTKGAAWLAAASLVVERSPAVGFDAMAGDEAGIVAGQEQTHTTDFGRLCHMTQRLQLFDAL